MKKSPTVHDVARILLDLRKRSYQSLRLAVERRMGCSEAEAVQVVMVAMTQGVFGLMGKDIVACDAELRSIANGETDRGTR